MPLAGHEREGTIVINYNFSSGIQGPHHPSPGARYSGTSRTAYLPDNSGGREVLRLLRICFDRKQTFTVGTSVTTGVPNCVVWNGVHHKTNTSGGSSYFGYPDATYFQRVTEELAAKGIH
jgi:deltex-like protein